MKCTAKTDQTGPMSRLIQIFAGGTDHFVGFAVLWPISRWQIDTYFDGYRLKNIKTVETSIFLHGKYCYYLDRVQRIWYS